jgi:predicted DNA-binding transcriptional regulator AlpA
VVIAHHKEPNVPDQELSETKRALEQFQLLPDPAFVKRPVVQALFATSDEGVDRGIAAGRIPKPVKIGKRVNGWQVGALRKSLAALAGAAAQ